jgi:integration host factor subunit alpha
MLGSSEFHHLHADFKADMQKRYTRSFSRSELAALPRSQHTITRADLAVAVQRKHGLSRNASAEIIEMVISEIADALAARETVKLSGFGTFDLRAKNPRLGRNPRTGVEADISARWVVVFRSSHILRARINAPESPAPAKDRS